MVAIFDAVLVYTCIIYSKTHFRFTYCLFHEPGEVSENEFFIGIIFDCINSQFLCKMYHYVAETFTPNINDQSAPTYYIPYYNSNYFSSGERFSYGY